MANNQSRTHRRWTEIRGMAVLIPAEGKRVGIVTDFFFEPDTNAVRALRINTHLLGNRILVANSIDTIGQDGVTIASEEMLIIDKHAGDIISLPLGEQLLTYKVKSEEGMSVGTVSNVLLETSRPTSLRIIAFELSTESGDGRGSRSLTFSANEVTAYDQNSIVILDKVAKGL